MCTSIETFAGSTIFLEIRRLTPGQNLLSIETVVLNWQRLKEELLDMSSRLERQPGQLNLVPYLIASLEEDFDDQKNFGRFLMTGEDVTREVRSIVRYALSLVTITPTKQFA